MFVYSVDREVVFIRRNDRLLDGFLCVSGFGATSGLDMFLLQSLPPLRAATHSRLYLCRHGETYSNSRASCKGGVDAQLNPTGRGQAASLAKELAFVQ